MADELAIIAPPLPPGLPDGTVVIKSFDDGTISIEHADPCVLISAELLDAIVDDPTPHARLDLTGCTTYDGAVLRIHGINRDLVYRITEYVPAVRGYIAEWPD